ncbi:putative type IX secretion system sortase PorU2 [Dyadobacter sp. MSC1_007]|jgi:hypothetical protein|uniref:putative type IX secretion system sortase PorU2 n=1 Tax=Dyadobacter sp. MSC1_007 TaxID=2909264 RepID=UPI00202FA177|nr:C25 family cysteine peptidase [Dyadobacter sp. MSC1_007]
MTRILTHTYLTIFLICCSITCTAQIHYGNEWIDYSLTYLRIPVVKTGFYKINARELASFGFPADSLSASSIKMYRHGNELPIEVNGDKNGLLGSEGSILFYGKKNDGAGDSVLYVHPKAMPHAYYSLYSDTTAYFLTWQNNGIAGKRINYQESATDSSSFHFEESLLLFNSHYMPGRFYPSGSNFENGSVLTTYDYGEGWTGLEITENASYEITIQTKKVAKEHFNNATIEMQIAGRTPEKRSFELWSRSQKHLKRKLASIQSDGYHIENFNAPIKYSDLDEAGNLTLTLMPIGKGARISVSYVRLLYPQSGPAVGTSWIVEPMQILPPRTVRFTQIDPETDYLIITHPLIRVPVSGADPVSEYMHYRGSKTGGGFNTTAVYSFELYDQFNGGQPGPQGICNAIRWLHDKGNLKFVLLAGRSIDPQKARKMPDSWQADMVPNAGWPGSDIALVTPADESGFYPIVPIGRINASTSQQLMDYLRKVKAMEAEPASAAWRKRILHLSGGRSHDELNTFKSYVKNFEDKLTGSSLGAEVQTLSKLTDNAVERLPLEKPLNDGVALITLFGHSAPDVSDVDIGFASDPLRGYQNSPRYPAVILNGCASGSIFYSPKTLSSDWLFTPESGAVLFLAHTFNGVSTALKRYTDLFYEVLADSAFTSAPFGVIQQEAIRRNMHRNPDIIDSITVQQMILHGDPAIRIFPARLPDYSIGPGSAILSDSPTANADGILAGLVIRNNGRFGKEMLQITISAEQNSKEIYSFKTIRPASPNSDTLFFQIPNTKLTGNNKQWIFKIDPANLLTEENEENNTLIIKTEEFVHPKPADNIPPLAIVTIDGRQIMNGEAISSKPVISVRILDDSVPLMPDDTSDIVIWLDPECAGCPEKRIPLGNAKGKRLNNGEYDFDLTLSSPLDPGKYHLIVQCRDTAGNLAAPYEIDFIVSNQYSFVNAVVSPNPADRWFRFNVNFEGPVDEQTKLMIMNANGTTVFEKVFKCHTGLNEWFWTPGPLPSGSYFYKLEPVGSKQSPSRYTRESMRGMLLYTR